MGTSASSKGPGGGVPLVPPWVPDPTPQTPPDGDDGTPANGDGQNGDESANPTAENGPEPSTSPTAPAGRFGGARLNFGKFAHDGGREHMQSGLRDYIRKGYGGGSTAVRRFGGTASTADALYGALSSVAGGQATGPGSPLDPVVLAGRSAREVVDAVIEAVRPADGTQDAEANRAAIKDALSELLTQFPDADLLNLTEDQRDIVIERFVAIDVYRRAVLDIGDKIREKAPTASACLARFKEVKDYIKQTVYAAFRKLRTAGTRLTRGRVGNVVRRALRETFEVFEAYLL